MPFDTVLKTKHLPRQARDNTYEKLYKRRFCRDEPGFDGASTANGWGAVKAYNTTTAYEGPTQPGLAMSLHEMPTMGVGESRSPINITEVRKRTVAVFCARFSH
jgi:hypothetical protein